MSINGIDQIGEIPEEDVANGESSTRLRRRSLPNINVPVGDETIKGMAHFSNVLDAKLSDVQDWQRTVQENVTKRSRKPTEKGLQYVLETLCEKRKRILSRLERKAENIRNLMSSGFYLRTVDEEFNQYQDLVKTFFDVHKEYNANLNTNDHESDDIW